MANIQNSAWSGKQPFPPPKSPFPSVTPAYTDCGRNVFSGSRSVSNPKDDRHGNHQRTSSESFLIDEHPSWLDELLDEPETPVRKGFHRRSSSDSFTNFDVSNMAPNLENSVQEIFRNRNVTSSLPWGSRGFDHYQDAWNSSNYAHVNNCEVPPRVCGTTWNAGGYQGNIQKMKNINMYQNTGSSSTAGESGLFKSPSIENKEKVDATFERRDDSMVRYSQPESDQKRSKQQFAQRSRVRKLQYIAELERNVQILQAEGSGISAELQFHDRQNLILSMENKALRNKLDSLGKERLIKHLQQEMFEREIARLQTLRHQQQIQQKQPPIQKHKHNHSGSKDLESQFANLSMNQTNPVEDTGTDVFHI